jgi:hypothetical protein
VVSKPSIRFNVKAGEGFNPKNIFIISSIEFLGPAQRLGLMGGFKTTSNKSYHIMKFDMDF